MKTLYYYSDYESTNNYVPCTIQYSVQCSVSESRLQNDDIVLEIQVYVDK